MGPALLLLLLAVLAPALSPARAAPAADEVSFLPGLAKQPAFRHFSGYLRLAPGRRLHYWYGPGRGAGGRAGGELRVRAGPG